MPTFQDYMQNVNKYHAAHNKQLRYGQVLFNVLTTMFPDIAMTVVDTKIDPFYITNAEDTGDFLAWLEQVLNS